MEIDMTLKLCLFSAIALNICTFSTASQAQSNDDWQFQVTPYLWATAIDGNTGTSAVQSDIDISAGDVIENLDMAFLVNLKAQKDHWGMTLDTVYMNLRPDAKGEPIELEVTAKQTLISGSVFYRPQAANGLELHLGARYVDLDNSFRITTSSPLPASSNKRELGDDWVETFVGARYTYAVSPKMNLIAYGDVAGFSGESDTMYQMMLSASYQYSKSWIFSAGYRTFVVDYDRDNFAYDATTDGLLIGGGYIF
jgi:hypothetical protein